MIIKLHTGEKLTENKQNRCAFGFISSGSWTSMEKKQKQTINKRYKQQSDYVYTMEVYVSE